MTGNGESGTEKRLYGSMGNIKKLKKIGMYCIGDIKDGNLAAFERLKNARKVYSKIRKDEQRSFQKRKSKRKVII